MLQDSRIDFRAGIHVCLLYLYVEADYLPMFRFVGQNRVLSRIHGEIDIERSELKRRVSHLRIPQKSPVSGQFAAGSRSILRILRIESEREHSRRPQRRQLPN